MFYFIKSKSRILPQITEKKYLLTNIINTNKITNFIEKNELRQ